MEYIERLLTNPFDELDGSDLKGFQDKCKEIAEKLFCHYCINCNGKEYYFTEIEFYYWNKRIWNKKWNRLTYPRICNAKDLLFHLSGIDVCFKSYYKKENLEDDGQFGGILIRSIRDEKDNVIAGPWNCMLKVLNECRNGQMPKLRKTKKTSCNVKENIKTTYRSLGKNDMKDEKEIANKKDDPLKLCFYDYRFFSENNGKQPKEIKITLNKESGKLKSYTSSYKIDRFK
ncbi:MAG: hypothetical protein IKS33_00815 [Bacteroidales bacterium]|jgi:hypothetical protein|nr:hypothetical protein [Bacteroidales bacterium]MBR4452780.1 hypothetical protein [Bacteroidales bacterium]